MQIQAQPRPDDALTRAYFDRHVLQLIRSGDSASALALRDLSQGFAAVERSDEPRIFWQASAAYFEAIALGLCPLTVESKRSTAQILLQYRAWLSGNLSGLKAVVQDLVFYCAQAVPVQEAAAPALSAIRATYGLAKAPSAPVEEEQFKVIGDLRIGIAPFNVFLNEADEWSRHLLTELNEWSLEPDRPVFDTTQSWVRALSIRSADALQNALQHVQPRVPCDMAHLRVFVETAEDIRRLLHQFAAGFLKTPDAQLMRALQDIVALKLPSVAPAGALKFFKKEADALLVPLGGALRQWVARPENLGAREEVLRVLNLFMVRAQQQETLHLWAHADAMREVIDMINTSTLETANIAPLQRHFEALKAALDDLPSQGV